MCFDEHFQTEVATHIVSIFLNSQITTMPISLKPIKVHYFSHEFNMQDKGLSLCSAMFKVVTHTNMKITSLLLVKEWGSEYFVCNKATRMSMC